MKKKGEFFLIWFLVAAFMPATDNVIKESEHPQLFNAIISGNGAVAESCATYSKWQTICLRYVIYGRVVDFVGHRPMQEGNGEYLPGAGWLAIRAWSDESDRTGSIQTAFLDGTLVAGQKKEASNTPPPSLADLEKFFLKLKPLKP